MQLGTAPAQAQRDVVEVTHPGGLMVLQAEDAGRIYTWATNATAYNWQRPAGRFRLLTGPSPPRGGDPTVVGDENRPIAGSYIDMPGPTTAAPRYDAFTNKLTIAVGGEYYDLHVLAAAADEQTTTPWNYWPAPPTAGSRDIYGIGRLPLDPGEARQDRNPNETTEYLDIHHRFTLIHDAVRIEYVVFNRTTRTLPIGLRQLIDASFGQWANDGGTVVLPTGQRIETERAIPDAEVTTVPESWIAYDRIDDPTMMLRGTLENRDVHDRGMADSAAGRPDRVEFGLMRSMGINELWDFIPNTAVPLAGENWAYAVRWDQADLAPGRSRRYVTYFGLGAASVDYDAPYALAAYSPVRLYVQEDNDTAAPADVGEFYLTDREGRTPFTVHAYADNFYPAPLVDASVRITLPEGFELDPPTQSLSKSLGTVERNELRSVSWTLRARAARPGVATIVFTGPLGKVVRRHIEIPVIPALVPVPVGHGLDMVSIPYTFVDNSIEHVFQTLGSMHVGGANGLAAWHPEELGYRWFPHAHVSTVNPGRGYWLLNQNFRTVYFPTDLQAVRTDVEYSLSLRRGWNQIGTPFTRETFLEGVRVIDPYGAEWSLREAVDRGLLLPTLFWYDPATNEYRWESELRDVRLSPYTGYWLYCFENLTLLFTPASVYTRSVGVGGPEADTGGDETGWRVPLTVSGAGRTRTQRAFGMAPDASDGLDRHDVPAPPRCPPDGVVLNAAFINPQTQQEFMQDVRTASTAPTEWLLAVETNAAGESMTIAWPDLSLLPADLVATFEDVASGERRHMRTHTSYSYRASAEGRRLFKITVRPRSAHRTLVTAATVRQGSQGATIVYSLAAEAKVDVEIRNISGVLIRQVASDRLGGAGVNTQVWDGRNARGAQAPPGRYLARITARSPVTGEQHSMVCSFQLAR